MKYACDASKDFDVVDIETDMVWMGVRKDSDEEAAHQQSEGYLW